jgi:RNA polymerase sigma-70 factor (ECF subfamily)
MRIIRRLRTQEAAQATDDPDRTLVEWARRDSQAFTAHYDRYFDAIYGYCLSQIHDPDAAEDLASQTFLKALAALPFYVENGRFRSWLFSIAHNCVLDAIKKTRTSSRLEDASWVADSASGPEERAIGAIETAWLDDVIARLPRDDQLVIELRRAGLTGSEIATVLGVSHEAAKKRQLRAVNKIRAEILKIPGYQEVLRGA